MSGSQVLKRLFGYVLVYKKKLVGIISIALCGVLFEVAKPLPVKIVIDYVAGKEPIPDVIHNLAGTGSAVDQKYNLLILSVSVLGFIALGSFLITRVVFIQTVKLAQRLVTDLMVALFGKLQQLSLEFYSRNKAGDLLQRISGDVFVAYFLVAQIILPALSSLVCLGIMFFIMTRIDHVLSLIALGVIPLLIISVVVYARPMSASTEDQYKSQGTFSAFMQQSLISMKIIQAFGREEFMNRMLVYHAEKFGNAFIKANRISMAYNQSAILITALASAALIAVGGYRGMNGNISPGDLFIFLGYLAGLYGPVNALVTAAGTMISLGARGKRVFETLDSDEVVSEKENAITKYNPASHIEFRNVVFGYENEQGKRVNVLNDVSFKTEPGNVIAIVGTTGAGKTSLISLLARFYDPWKGSIHIDQINIQDISLKKLRDNISLVLQDPFIFPMTIGENIAFGNPSCEMNDVIAAAKSAQAHDFIMKLEKGYDTQVTELGNSLSGGEKQRIAIARAFLKNAPILIMDEPTSALDAITEAKIFKAIHDFANGRTIFLVSHRLSSIKHADKIITLRDGKIAEEGTHDTLINTGNFYAELFRYQHIQ